MFYSISKKRLILVLAIIYLLTSVLVFRLSYIMTAQSNELSVMTDNQYTIYEPTNDLKFMLQDSKGNNMLNYVTKYYFVLDLSTFIRNSKNTDLKDYNTLIYTLRNYNRDYDLTDINKDMLEKKLYYEIDEETYNKIIKLKDIKGIYCFKKEAVDTSKPWRYENMIINPVDSGDKRKDANSLEGFVWNKVKNNDYPQIAFEKDNSGIISPKGSVSNEKNINIRLTTDKLLEDNVRDILHQDKYSKFDQIGVAVMESNTGKIIAMAQKDDFKPNILLCSTTENGYEPGSIFKTIVSEAALSKNMNYANMEVACKEVGEDHGIVDMRDAYEVSCNTFFSKLGGEIGFKNIFEMAKSQGLLDKVLGFNGTNEVTGDIVASKNIDLNSMLGDEAANMKNIRRADGTEAMIGIGQSIRITPLQALNIVNTVINNGVYIKPYLIKELFDNKNNVIQTFASDGKQIIDPAIAKTIKNFMRNVVTGEKGTGKQANIAGVDVGGKTGTNTRYEGKVKHSDGWFIGYFDCNGKYYSVVVFVKDIDVVKDGGGSTAAPIFKEIAQKIIQSYKN